MGDERRTPLNVVLRRSLKKFRALPLSERLEELIKLGIVKEPEATQARKRVAAMEATAAAAKADPPPAAS